MRINYVVNIEGGRNMLPHPFQIPNEKKIRVIITTDANNEADDQYAIAYALMSPKLEVVGIAAVHFSKKDQVDGSINTAQQSYDEIVTVLKKMNLFGKIPVLMGAAEGLQDEDTPIRSEASDFIIREAHTDGMPLYIVNLGAITDLASAYLLDPTIAEGIEAAVWLGGGRFPEGGPEFNLMNDIAGGNVIMNSNLNVWLIPINASASMRVGFAELIARVQPYGEIGEYLVKKTFEVNERDEWTNGENWIIWDMAGIAVLLDPHNHQFNTINAPCFDENMNYISVEREHAIRVYERIEPRYAMEDFYAKLMLNYGK